MASVLSDQAYAEDPNAVYSIDNDLKLRDLHQTTSGIEEGVLHEKYTHELTEALQKAIANNSDGIGDQTYSDLDFDHDGVNDTYTTMTTEISYDDDGDGIAELIMVGAVDLDADGIADIADKPLNGIGGKADVIDLMEANESTVLYDIAYSDDYSITVKDDGKLLYRWGGAVKRPNDLRMEADMDLPSEWTEDSDSDDIPDILQGGHNGFVVTKAELTINHEITNNPNDQVRPEDYENDAAIGRLPSHYIIADPDDANNILWVSPVNSWSGAREELPSYLALDENGDVDLDPSLFFTHDAVYDPIGRIVGYRNQDENGNNIGTVLRDLSLVDANEAAELTFSSEDIDEGFTEYWYTTVDREPFEWSYDEYRGDPYRNVFESFSSRELAEAEGYTDYDLVSGPRWRLTPNKFGQDLPGLEVPLIPNSQPPFNNSNIKYETGEDITTTLNLLDWDEDIDGDGKAHASPLAHSLGWMTIDTWRLDVDRDGRIDEGWSNVNGSLQSGDLLPTDPILYAVTANGATLVSDALDTSVYVKGDRQDSAQIYDMHFDIEYTAVIGTVDYVTGVDHTAQTVEFQGGSEFVAPVVLAYMNTFNGSQMADVSLGTVSSDSVTLYVEEPDYLDGKHLKEDITVVALESGSWELVDGSRVEVGTIDVAAGETSLTNRSFVAFDNAFDDIPLVMAQLQTDNGVEWTTVRLSNVTTNGFSFFIQEEEAADGIHDAEVLGYVAIDSELSSGMVDWGGVMGQAIQLSDAVDNTPDDFNFDPTMGLDPLVLAQMASTNGSDTGIMRMTGLSDDTAWATGSFKVQEDVSKDAEIRHNPEDISALAFATEGFLAGDAFVFA